MSKYTRDSDMHITRKQIYDTIHFSELKKITFMIKNYHVLENM